MHTNLVRNDGRAPDQLRAVRITPNFQYFPSGSALVEFGRTRVICAASVEERVPPFLVGTGRGWVSAEYSMLPSSTPTRTPRETYGRPSGRSLEIQRLIGRSLRAAVNLDALGERTIIVDCDVIDADGGTRTAAITGGLVALALALRRLQADGVLDPAGGPYLQQLVAAVSVGIVDGMPVLDLNYEEDSTAEADCNVVMTETGWLVEVQATAERKVFSYDEMSTLLNLARKGINQLIRIQRETLGLAGPASTGLS